MAETEQGASRRRMPQRSHSNFLTRSARDETEQLARRGSTFIPTPSPSEEQPLLQSHRAQSGLDAHDARPDDTRHRPGFFGTFKPWNWIGTLSGTRRQRSSNGELGRRSSSAHGNGQNSDQKANEAPKIRSGAFPRPVGGSSKLGTFNGVFVPTSLNVLSILMFLRFGFILGQSGLVAMLGMLVACYAINLITTLSISAIATNGTVRGGGPYYLISRSLGPEFGGSIGIVCYLGFVFNTGMNAVGLIDCLKANFGQLDGSWSQWMPEGFWWQYLWATIVLIACTAICLAGSGLFARCSNALLVVLLISTFSIPFSALVKQPFEDSALGIRFTGPSLNTLKENLLPNLTKHAAGSQLPGKENFQDLFGILFPATGGIFAGASMSGDLKHPSKAIPKGTLYGLLLTFFSYTFVILAMAASITRESFYRDLNVIQNVNLSGVVILLGECATSLFSVLMGVIGSAKLLQALSRDDLIPGLSIFGQGTKNGDEPTYGIFITYAVAQITMLADINKIASFVTMTYLMTFLVTNLACFLLKISSAPNFRPSFHYFNWWTAAIGTVISGITMFFVDGLSASGCVALLLAIFLVIHYTTPPKPWGDVSQSLIYHQVRKYLLRLRPEHVKFWRPQILLFINDPRRQYKLIQFCNSLKKGGLFMLGHVIVAKDFGGAVPEAKRQQASWTKYIDFSKIKAFVNIVVSPAIEWGARNLVLGAGLGGMRPNIVMMGFFNLGELRGAKPFADIPTTRPNSSTDSAGKEPSSAQRQKRRAEDERMSGKLPTDAMRPENAIRAKSYLTILEDLLLRLQLNVAIGKGFQELEMPSQKPSLKQRSFSLFHSASEADQEEQTESTKKYIDLWPIQMSAEIAPGSETDPQKRSLLTTNFDTYTLILQLGCILNTVPSWKRTYKLRVAVFVEYETDVEEERGRVISLLANLRIEADVIVFWLASGSLKSYEIIVNGRSGDDYADALKEVDDALVDEEWWLEIQKLRGKRGSISASQELERVEDLLGAANNWAHPSFRHGRGQDKPKRFAGLRKMIKRTRRRQSLGDLSGMGLNLGRSTMRTHRLADLAGHESDSSSDSDEASDSEAVESDSENAVASETDFNRADDEASDSDQSIAPVQRAFTVATGGRLSMISRENRAVGLSDSSTAAEGYSPYVEPNPRAAVSDSMLVDPSKPATSVGTASSAKNLLPPQRPPVLRESSHPKFTSKPQPPAQVAATDGPGPSIMFSEQPSPSEREPQKSIYDRNGKVDSDNNEGASGFPASQSIPISFNDLPCRAQHLILNELIRQQSGETAVVFTTLPSPMEGTCESEKESVRYLRDLDVLCQDLPPVLLVHSNTMTVTMNL